MASSLILRPIRLPAHRTSYPGNGGVSDFVEGLGRALSTDEEDTLILIDETASDIVDG